jgi:hypothetical protein
MAEEFLLLTTQAIPVNLSDRPRLDLATLRLDAVDIMPGGDVVLQMAFTNETPSTIPWTNDDGNSQIYLTDEQGNATTSAEAGGLFGRDIASGLPPGATFYGWHRFRLPDLKYRGTLTLHYPFHGEISFSLSSAR